ncbi:serine/threonine-protein kinase [Nakamurella panacisegetis]|nr:serine/threonine-protein kinase [Nakamurella panacisegetis]
MTFEVGDYRAFEMIGAGASAQVWRGAHKGTGGAVALKVFPAAHLRAARREAALAAAVDHPHVVRVIEVIGDAERCALVTEYAGGGDLAGLLAARGRLTAGETLTVLLPVAAVLATAHERDVVHGDLSAGNVVFDAAGRPLVADLGAGRAGAEVGLPVSATPADAAPELARGATPSPATDMFSLGSLALACLTGHHAWPADDLHDVLIQAAGGQWPDPGDDVAPPALTAVIRALLEHDPERRPGAAAVVMDLRGAGRPAPVELAQPASVDGPGAIPGSGPAGAVVVDVPGSSPRHGAPEVDPPSDGPDRRCPGPEHDRDRLVRERAITKIRADAVPRPAPESDAGRLRRMLTRWPVANRMRPGGAAGRARPIHRSRAIRVGVIAAVCVLVACAAAAGGLWWAGLDRRDPAVATRGGAHVSETAAVGPSSAVAPGPSAVVPPPRPGSSEPAATEALARSAPAGPTRATTSRTAAPAPAPTPRRAASPSTSAAGHGVDWTATVQKLDADRATAVTARRVGLLDAVYTAGSSARAADAGMIERLIASRLRVSGAQHRVAATKVVGTSPIRVRVSDALPAYSILDESGQVVGRTTARPAAARVLVLVATPSGYRISAVESG